MRTSLVAALALGAVPIAAGMAQAQTVPVQAVAMTGTRLDVNATGEVTRVPDLAIISAGVQTLQPTATAAIEENAARMPGDAMTIDQLDEVCRRKAAKRGLCEMRVGREEIRR